MTELSEEEQLWQLLHAIPPGKVATYGQLARLLGYPQRARWVGRILSQLPRDTQLPWHRVVNAQGKISPRNSEGFQLQSRRLQEEDVSLLNGKIQLHKFQWEL